MTKEQKLEKLKARKSKLEDKLFEAKQKEHERLNRMGFGYGMRHSKINFSTRISDNIQRKIDDVDVKISELKNEIETGV